MAPSYRPVNLSTPLRDESMVAATNDYHLLLRSHQPFLPYEQRCRLLTTGLPTQGHVDRLPSVANLLERHDRIQNRDRLVAAIRDPRYELQRLSSTMDPTFECWTPPSLTGRPSTSTSPALKLVPLTAGLTTSGNKGYAWTSNGHNVGPPSTDSVLNSWTDHAKTLPSVLWSLESTRGPRDSRSKNSRYLREIDRRRILIRIAQGEKQSALAKEYHVSRAAICNLNKHRAEVLSRNHEHPLAKHPKRRILTKLKRPDFNGHYCIE